MSDILEELVARVAKAQQRLAALEVKERPLALRGWRDDFLGDALADQYTAVAGGTIALQDSMHGGIIRLTTSGAAWNISQLWLGANADTARTLRSTEGWIMLCRFCLNTNTNVQLMLGAQNNARTRQIFFGLVTGWAPNWLLVAQDGGGTTASAGTAGISDTNWHWVRMEVIPSELRAYLDGALVITHTTNIPADYLTPVIDVRAEVAVAKNVDVDYIAWIPMNLI